MKKESQTDARKTKKARSKNERVATMFGLMDASNSLTDEVIVAFSDAALIASDNLATRTVVLENKDIIQ